MGISKEKLLKNLSLFGVRVFDEISSTNTFAKGEPCFTVVAADKQTEGRGRIGKSFFSPEGGVYMSVVLPEATLATIRTAIAVCRAVERNSVNDIGIKWVNDIFSGGKKVAGILCELSGDKVVCGIGININRSCFPKDISETAGSIQINAERESLISDIANELLTVWDLPNDAVIGEYKSRLFMLGARIEYIKNGEPYNGIAADINAEGNLIVEKNGNTDILNSGEISLGSDKFSHKDK